MNKVAFLGYVFELYPQIIDILNSGVSWDLDSILHTNSTNVREWNWARWRNLRRITYAKDEVLVQSRNFNGSLEDWGQRLMYRAGHGALPLWRGAPDILAFELEKEPERIRRPTDFVPAESVEDLYAVLPDQFVSKILGDFYASSEWRWSVRYPDRRGF